MRYAIRLVAIAGIVMVAACVEDDAPPPSDTPPPEPMADTGVTPQAAAVDDGYLCTLVPRESAEITAPFTTDVLEYKVNIGDHVEIGDVIALLDEAPIKEQLAIEQGRLKAMRAGVSQAAASSKAAKIALKRAKNGLRDQVSSRAEVDDAAARAHEAGAGVAQAAGSVQEQQARINVLANKLADMTVKAPIAGKLATRFVEPGSKVEEGALVVRVIASDEVVARFAIPAKDVGRVKQGDEVEMTVKDSAATATMKVKSVAPELDPIARFIWAEADVVKASLALQSGLECRIHPAPVQGGAPTK